MRFAQHDLKPYLCSKHPHLQTPHFLVFHGLSCFISPCWLRLSDQRQADFVQILEKLTTSYLQYTRSHCRVLSNRRLDLITCNQSEILQLGCLLLERACPAVG